MRHHILLVVLLSLAVSLPTGKSDGDNIDAHETETKPNTVNAEGTSATTPASNSSTVNAEGTSATTPASNSSTANTEATSATTPASNSSTANTEATSATTPASNSSTANTEATSATTPASNSSTGNTEATSATTPASNSSTANTEATSATTPASNSSTANTEATSATTPASNSSTGNTEATSATTPASNSSTANTEATSATTPASNSSTGNTEATSATTPASNSSTVDRCNPNPCGNGSAKCIALHSNFTCECQYGFYYSSNSCQPGKIFPGVIMLNTPYSDDAQTVNSTQYEEIFQNITKFFKEAFTDLTGFEQTIITKIQSQQEVRASLSTRVTVINLFTENTDVDVKEVTAAIHKTAETSSDVSGYEDAKYCDAYNCDSVTTVCKENMFPTCECKDNFSKTPWDVLSCSDCSKSCSDETHEYCAKEKGVPQCKCKPNFKRKDGVCVQCPVGYSGDNCNNNSELILIIVGTVLGAIILSLLIAVIVLSVRTKHKQDPEKRSLIRSGYSNPNASDERPNTMFPRVQTTSGHANPGYQPNNPYEMRSANRGRFPEADYSDMYDVSREPGGFRMQSRY